ncbi:MAG: DNA-binding protein [Ferruginibacter sp.]|nr:DNA-binding protein [Chitinophagaceae bacterium]
MPGENNRNLPVKLASPARRALAAAGITTLKQLSRYSEKEIAALHGIGQNAVAEIKQALIKNKLSFLKNKETKK